MVGLVPRDDLDALVTRAQDGDVRAFEELIASHLDQVRRFARAFARCESDADDLAQEALIKTYKSIRTFRYQSAFSTWLYAVVRSVFLDFVKSRAGRERLRAVSLVPEHTRDLVGGVVADEALAHEEERERVWRALRQVPVEFRTALVLFDIEGRTYDEIAAIEWIPVGTVRSRLSRGRAHLKRLLGEGPAPSLETDDGEVAITNPGTRAGGSSSNVR